MDDQNQEESVQESEPEENQYRGNRNFVTLSSGESFRIQVVVDRLPLNRDVIAQRHQHRRREMTSHSERLSNAITESLERRIRYGSGHYRSPSMDYAQSSTTGGTSNEKPNTDCDESQSGPQDSQDSCKTPSVSRPRRHATSRFRYLQQREYGQVKVDHAEVYKDALTRRLPGIIREYEFNGLGTMNKIFASKWLNDKQVVFGTKCNQLVVLDVHTGQLTSIPMLKCSQQSAPAEQPCGIHGISINPSATMLATGACNTNDIAIYRLPTFDPLCVGEGAHSDWVFDLEWIDDEFLITGSRDNMLALWRIQDGEGEGGESPSSPMSCLYVPEYSVRQPLVVKTCARAQKVRALSINRSKKEMAVLSLNAFLHLWDIETFSQMWSSRLTCNRENVCMAVSEEKNLYAVGSHSSVTLVDCRKRTCESIPTKQRDRGLFQGIRSLSFQRDIITIGTGTGMVMFYDVRASKYLESLCGHPCQLSVGSGWIRQDENFRDIFVGARYPNAIYTHVYDSTGVRLFAAGGPLPAGLWGNYAALWA